MKLHDAIMNLPCIVPADETPSLTYKIGFRDCRHAAAELALAADAEIDEQKQTLTHMAGHVADLSAMVDGQSAEIAELRNAVQMLLDVLDELAGECDAVGEFQAPIRMARAALEPKP